MHRVLCERGEGREGGGARRDGVAHQPRVNHGAGRLPNEVVLEKVRVLVQKCFHAGKFSTEKHIYFKMSRF